MSNLPILRPLEGLFKSRKFIVALMTATAGGLVTLRPELAAVQGDLVGVLTALGLAVIGGIAWEDAAKAGKEEAVKTASPLDEIARQLGYATTDEFVEWVKANAPAKGREPTAYTASAVGVIGSDPYGNRAVWKASDSPAVIPEGKG